MKWETSLAKAIDLHRQGNVTKWQLQNPDVDIVTQEDGSVRGEIVYTNGIIMTLGGTSEIKRVYLNNISLANAYDYRGVLLDAANLPGVSVNGRSEGKLLLEFRLGIVKEILEDGLERITDSKIIGDYDRKYTAQFEILGKKTIIQGLRHIEYMSGDLKDLFFTIHGGLGPSCR